MSLLIAQPLSLAALLAFSAVIGLLIGSALTVIVPAGALAPWVLRRRSRCESCGQTLGVADLVPVVSFLVLRGRCRLCGVRVPVSNLLTEVGAAVLFVVAAAIAPWQSPLDLVVLWALLALLLALALVDLCHFLLPDALVGALAVVGALRSVISGAPGLASSLAGGIAGLLALGFLASLPLRHVSSSVTRRSSSRSEVGPAMGLGDVKLAGALGLTLGLQGLAVTLFLAFVSGGLVGGMLLLLRRATLRTHVPFGPFLAASAAVLLLAPSIVDRFLGTIGLI